MLAWAHAVLSAHSDRKSVLEVRSVLFIHCCAVCMNLYIHMNKEKNLSPSQGLNLGLPNTSQMLLPLRHQDS